MELKLYENIHTEPNNTETLIRFLRFFLIILNAIYIQILIQVVKAFKVYFLLSSTRIFPKAGVSIA